MAQRVEMKMSLSTPPIRKVIIMLALMGYSHFSGLPKYALGWYSRIYYWIYPGITAVTIMYGLIRLIIQE
jgi:hypothetical protein